MNNQIHRLFKIMPLEISCPFLLAGLQCFCATDLFAQLCPITYDSANSTNVNAQSVTLSLTVSGSNRFLVVQVGVNGNDGASAVTQVTYAGVPVSQVLQTIRAGGGGARQATFALVAPSLGTNNVVIHLGGANPMNVGAIDYNGVDQTTPLGATTFLQDASILTHSVPLTTTTSQSLILSSFLWYSNTIPLSSLGSGQTQRWLQGANDRNEGDDYLSSSIGLYTLSYVLLSASQADIQAIEIRSCGQPANTPTGTPTSTPTTTTTSTPTNTSINTPSSTPTTTKTPTPTYTPTPTPSNTPSGATTFTPTPAPASTQVPDGVFGATHNAFHAGTETVTFFYNVPQPTHVQLSIYSVLGMRVKKLVDEYKPAGVWSVSWDGRNEQRNLPASDVYFILLKVGDKDYLRKVGVLNGSH